MTKNTEITGVLVYLSQDTKRLLEIVCELDGVNQSEAIARALVTHSHISVREKRGYRTLFVNEEDSGDIYELVLKENVPPRNTNPNQES